jgi:hypothetical protein
MIRVPSIAILRPWPVLRARRPAKAQADILDSAAQELTRKRLEATVERERYVTFSAGIDGRPIV